jgi:hypothetical protein
MTPRTATCASPFNCRWIVPGSEHHAAGWSYAICTRVRDTERLVNETDCAHCPRWEEPDDLAEQHAALAWNSMTGAGRAVTIMKASTEIGMPVVHVFRKFVDIERSPANVSAIAKIEMLTPGGVRLGARWRETRQIRGRVDDAEMELTSFEQNRMYTITRHNADVRIETTFWFRPAPGGTKVTVELVAPLEGAVNSEVAEMLKHDLADLKQSFAF